jgi:hypothetical protein
VREVIRKKKLRKEEEKEEGEHAPKYLYVKPLPFSKIFTSNTTSFFSLKEKEDTNSNDVFMRY